MTDLLDDFNQKQKLYKETPIWTAALLGGPLAGAYLLSYNFKKFNDPQKAKLTWIIAASGIVLHVLCALTPLVIAFYGLYIFPFLFMAIANVVVEKFQKTELEQHEATKGLFHTSLHVLPMAIAGLVVYHIPIIALFLYNQTVE